ncbi:MAG TPA: hypothetical protein VIL55_11665 [Naasia sp.]
MPAPIPDDERAAILDDIRAGQLSRNAIARKHKRSVGLVTKLAHEDRGADAFDRSHTEKATRARRTDLAAARAELAERWLHLANELLDQTGAPYLVHAFAGKDGVFRQRELPRPPSGDLRNLVTSAAVATDKHLVLERHDTDDGVDAARSMLGDVAAAIGDAYAQVKAAEQAEEVSP